MFYPIVQNNRCFDFSSAFTSCHCLLKGGTRGADSAQMFKHN